MAYFKKQQMKSTGKWYPVATTIGKPVTTKEVATRLADLSSLSTGDVLSVLELLGGVLGDYMNQGRTVKLDGMGTFYYTTRTSGTGVDTPEEVSGKQITGTRVRFLPETRRSSSNKVTRNSMVSDNVFWQLLDDSIPAAGVEGSTGESGGGTGGGGEEQTGGGI